MTWRRKRAKGDPPKWSSLKEGDVVMIKDGPRLLVSIQRRGCATAYWKDGRFLNLHTGELELFSLDDVGVRAPIVRGPRQEKKGILQPSEGLSLREGAR